MSDLRRIFGTSLMTVLLVVWGLFMVCSGRVPDVNYDDELFSDEADFGEDYNQSGNSELMSQLAELDEETTTMENSQRNEILEALGISPSGSEISRKEQDFLSEELFLDLEVEIAELEKMNKKQDMAADSLRREIEEADYQLAALDKIVEPSGGQYDLASKDAIASTPAPMVQVSNSEYAASYQDALNDIYARKYNEAIAKFRQLLKFQDTDKLADNCQYWIGEAYYAQGNYEAAIAEFEKVFAFDDNNKVDDAQFMIGLAYIKIGDPAVAQIELRNLMAFYQDSEYLARAEREFNTISL